MVLNFLMISSLFLPNVLLLSSKEEETYRGCVNGGQQSLDIAKQFPHMALLGYQTTNGAVRYACHGMLVDHTLVLTLSFCVQPFGAKPKTVRLGIPCDRQQISNVKRIIYHSRKSIESPNDVVLMQFEPPVRYTDFVQPLLQATSTHILAGQTLTSAVWIRKFSNGQPMYDVEKRLSLAIDQEICEQLYCTDGFCPIGIDNTTTVHAESVFCVNDYNLQENDKKLELGGVHLIENGTLKAVGILANVLDSEEKVPKLFLRIGKYLKWIEYIKRRY